MCHIVRCIALYDAENWTLRSTVQKYFESYEVGKDGADQLDGSCEKLSVITQSQGKKEHPTYKKEG
jgi:hypothetical protein